jgi:3-oxoadipate enol-lactonase
MPYAQSGPVRLHYERSGTGPAVLLVMGLGMNATGWWRTVPVLAERLEVIAFDNRGVGRSDRPEAPYTVGGMADDCAAVLDAAGVEHAHVYGLSLGGMIAQELALGHPARVDRLVLGATTPGGERGVPADEVTLGFFARRAGMTAEEAVWASVPYNYGRRTRAERAGLIGEDIVQRLRYPIEQAPYRAQLEAAMGHDAGDRLAQIRAETLVVHGEDDRMVPVANAHLLAGEIPGARADVWPEAGHLYTTDEPEADRRVLAFLSR